MGRQQGVGALEEKTVAANIFSLQTKYKEEENHKEVSTKDHKKNSWKTVAKNTEKVEKVCSKTGCKVRSNSQKSNETSFADIGTEGIPYLEVQCSYLGQAKGKTEEESCNCRKIPPQKDFENVDC